jgi:hypothetical protein
MRRKNKWYFHDTPNDISMTHPRDHMHHFSRQMMPDMRRDVKPALPVQRMENAGCRRHGGVYA